MKKIKWPVILVTTYVLLCQLALSAGVPDGILIIMYTIAPIPTLWMAYQVLKHGTPSQRTFDEYFYEDNNYKRNKES